MKKDFCLYLFPHYTIRTMDIMEFRDFCLSLPLTDETTPFDEDVLVYKIGGKMFVYASMSDFTWLGVKCDPAHGADLRERYAEISPAPHMNKVHWIRLDLKGSLTDAFLKERLRDSYRLVIRGMTRARRSEMLAAIAEEAGGDTAWLSE